MLLVLLNAVHHRVSVRSIGHLALSQEVVENADSLTVPSHFRWRLLLYFWEVQTVLFKDLVRCLLWQLFKHLVDLSALAGEYLELFRLNDELVLWTLAHESFQKLTTFLDKAVLLVTEQLLFRDCRDIAARPPFVKLNVKRKEFVVSALDFKTALAILACHSVLDNTSHFYDTRGFVHFNWVSDCEIRLMVTIILKTFCLWRASCLRSVLEGSNLLNKLTPYSISSFLHFQISHSMTCSW